MPILFDRLPPRPVGFYISQKIADFERDADGNFVIHRINLDDGSHSCDMDTCS